MNAPLRGFRVVDISRAAPGPLCSLILAEMGARVTVVEEPETPSSRRQVDAAIEASAGYGARGVNAARASLYRNKESIILNLREQPGRDALLALAREADVFIEGFRPGVAQRLGAGYADIAAVNPRVVYASLTGYGQTGPYAQLPGHDINYLAVSGVLSVLGGADGRPIIPLNLLGDLAGGGLSCALAIAFALLARERTGEGQQVDMSMTDGAAALMGFPLMDALLNRVDFGYRQHTLNGRLPYYNTYVCQDGKRIALGALEPWLFRNLCDAVGCGDFVTAQYDEAKYPDMFVRFEEAFRTRPRDEWFAWLSQRDVPASPVLGVDELVDNEHLVARGMVRTLRTDGGAVVPFLGTGLKLTCAEEVPGVASERPGQSTRRLLREIGQSDPEIELLIATGVAGEPA